MIPLHTSERNERRKIGFLKYPYTDENYTVTSPTET